MTVKNKRRVPIETPFDRCETAEQHREELIDHLKTALILEHATIPPYLCALYSIKEGTNLPAAHRIRSVAVEEMLHMVLVANLLNAIGGTPSLANDKFVPSYPTTLPRSDKQIEILLRPFSPDAIENFMEIERPREIDEPPKHEDYSSIGQFYAAIKDELDFFCREFGEEKLFTGDPDLQVTPLDYYSGGGEIVEVTNYDSARKAIKVIVDEGEGFGHSIFSGDHEQFGELTDLAHFYKFNEIAAGRVYRPDDSPARDPTGQPLAVDFSPDAVYPAKFYRTNEEYSQDAQRELREFNRTYSRLLLAIESAFNEKRTHDDGPSKHFQDAVGLMYEVKFQMIRLMKIPMDNDGNTIGPTFVFVN